MKGLKERAKEYKAETGREYNFAEHKLSASDPKLSFMAYRHNFEAKALETREIDVKLENIEDPYWFDFDETINTLEAHKKALLKYSAKFAKMNEVDPKGWICDHIGWCKEVIDNCNEMQKYCRDCIEDQIAEQEWESKRGA